MTVVRSLGPTRTAKSTGAGHAATASKRKLPGGEELERSRSLRSPREFGLFLGTGGLRSKLDRGDRVQDSAHVGGALRPECLLKLPLRLHPSLRRAPETGFASLGHLQLFAPAIAATLFDGDQAVALQRQDVPAECGSVHHHLCSEGIDRHRAQSPQLREN